MAERLEAQLKEEVSKLLRLAEQADQSEKPDGMDIPAELARRETRLAAIAKAKAEIEDRAKERYEREQTVYKESIARQELKEKQTGKKPRGRDPKPPVSGPRKRDQVNLTDKESRIMPASGKSFVQAYNAQAAVDSESLLIVTSHVSQKANDLQELKPTLEKLEQLPECLGKPKSLLADAGYFSKANVIECAKHKVTPYIASGRDGHNKSLEERFKKPPPLPDSADLIAVMKHRLKTSAGKKLYAKRKSTVEPVFGIIKHVLGFRQFLLRGLDAVEKEWDLVCMAWNIKRMHALRV